MAIRCGYLVDEDEEGKSSIPPVSATCRASYLRMHVSSNILLDLL